MSSTTDVSPRSATVSTPAPAAPAERGRSMTYEPALDGIRALAVTAVLLFHNGFSWMGGGFLGVSTFFTLSGFLITSLLLLERERSSSVDLRAFWARRFRRLLPASLVCLLLVLAVGAAVGSNAQQVALRGDILSALAYVANWHFVVAGSSYAGIFAGGLESPAQHFWSLAIEEQFYLIFPLLVFVATRVLGTQRRTFAVVLGGLWAASLGLTLLYANFGWVNDRIYYGTDTRALELLTGGLLAIVLAGRTTIASSRVRRAVVLGAPSVLSVTVVLWTSVGVTDRWLHTGGFALYSLLSAVLIVAAVQPDGPIRALLSVPAARWLGKVSYGAYLYHFPIFLYVRETTDLPDWPRFALATSVTLVAAELSYRFVELPVRAGGWPRGRTALALFPAAALSVALVTTAITWGYEAQITFDDSILDVDGPPRIVEGVPRVAVYGDSTMLSLAFGLRPYMDRTGVLAPSPGAAELGCGIGRGGYRQHRDIEVRPILSDCWDRPWTDSIAKNDPDVAVILVGPWDVADRWLEGEDPESDPPRFPGDPVYDDFLLREFNAAVDVLTANGAKVIWLTSPQIELGMVDGELGEVQGGHTYTDDQGVRHYAGSDPARMARLNELIREVAAARPTQVKVVDLAGYIASLPTGPVAPDLRPDGVHFSKDGGAQRVVDDWLGPQIEATVAEFGLLGAPAATGATAAPG